MNTSNNFTPYFFRVNFSIILSPYIAHVVLFVQAFSPAFHALFSSLVSVCFMHPLILHDLILIVGEGRAGLAQLELRQATGWMAEAREEQEFLLFSTASRRALGPTQPPI
jgi:hypothetical protein